MIAFSQLLSVIFPVVDDRINRLAAVHSERFLSNPTTHTASFFLASILDLPPLAELHLVSITIFFGHYCRDPFFIARNEPFQKWFVPF